MVRPEQFKIGSKVMANRFHWLRPFATGTITEFHAKRAKSWRVEFDETIAGGGFMEDDKQCLWFSTEDLTLLEEK